MTRLSEMERAERKMIRKHLEVLPDKCLRKFALKRGIDLHGASTHLCVVNTIMNQYDKWASNG